MSEADLRELRGLLHALVGAIEAGELHCTPMHLGLLYGALALATALTDSRESDDITP